MNERIKKIRKHKDVNMTQPDFGKRIGVTAAAISKMETSASNPSEQIILAICREFNVNEEWLRTGEGGDGAMFELYDDTELTAMFSRYSMDSLSKGIITSYVKLHPEKRKLFGEILKEFAGSILDGDIESTKRDLFNELLNHFPGGPLNEYQLDNVVNKINGAFDKFLPSTIQHDPPPVKPTKPSSLVILRAKQDLYRNERDTAHAIIDAQAEFDAQFNEPNKKGASSS